MFFRWLGGSSGVWALATNWRDAAGNAVTTYPNEVAGRLDDAYFDQAATNAPAGATIANKLRSVKISPALDKDFATSGSYMKFDAEEVTIDANVNVYIEGNTGDGIQKITCLRSASGKKIYLKGKMANPLILDAAVEVGAGTISGSFAVGSSSTSTAAVVINTGVTLPDDVRMSGGNVTNNNAISGANGILSIMAGAWIQAAGDLTTAKVFGGTLDWKAGNVGTLLCYGGTTTGANGASTRRIGAVTLYSSATLNLDNGLGNIHVTNYVENLGGTFTPSKGFKIEEYRSKTYAGASDAKFGVSPQSIAAGNSVWGDDLYLGLYDRLDVYVTVGDTDATEVKCELWECADPATHTGETEITTPAEVTFGATDDNKTKVITLWGYQMTAGKSSVRAKVTVTGGTAGLVCVAYVQAKV